MTIKENIRNNIRYLQSSVGLKHKDLAEKLCLKERTWASYLEGRAKPPIEVLVAICDLFKFDLDAMVRSKLEEVYEFKEVKFFRKK